MVTANVNDLESENATMQMELKTLSKTYSWTEAGNAKNLGERFVDLVMKTRDCDAL